MELLAIGTYHAPEFTLKPGDDTLHLEELSDERKARILADFPDLVEEIVDVEAYKAEKAARLAEQAATNAVPAEVVERNPFETDPENTMSSADDFSKADAQKLATEAIEAEKTAKKAARKGK